MDVCEADWLPQLDSLRESLAHHCGAYDVRGLRPGASGSIAFRSQPFDVCWVKARAVGISRLRRTRGGHGDAFIMAQLRGRAVVRHNQIEEQLGAGDLLLVTTAMDLSAISVGDVVLASAPVDAPIVDLIGTRHYGRRIDGGSPTGRLLSGVLASLLSKSCDLGSMEDALDGVSGGEGDDGRSLRVLRHWARAHLADPGLDPARMASRLAMSVRQLYRLFERQATTPMAWLGDLRLECAREQLAGGGREVSSITDIALANGFSDASQFSRAFRRRFAMAPRDYRHQHSYPHEQPAPPTGVSVASA